MRFFFAAVLVSCFLYSCTSRAVQPTRQSRHTIDTLFQQKIMVLKPEMDSVCAGIFKDVYSTAIDSIMDARKQEMDILVK